MKRKTIGFKILLLFTGALLFNTFFLLAFIGLSGSKFLYNLGDQYIQNILSVIELALIDDLEKGNYRPVQAFLEKTISREESIDYYQVYDSRGSLAALAVRGDVTVMPDPPDWIDLESLGETRETQKRSGDIRRISLIRDGETPAGAIIAQYNRSILTGQVNRVRTLLIFHSLLMLIVGGALFYLGIGKFTRSLADLSRLTRRFGEEDFDFQYEYRGNDEIGDLADSLTRMTGQIKSSFKLLKTSEERFELAVQGSRDGIWDFIPYSKTFYTSPRCLEILDCEGVSSLTMEDWIGLSTEEDRECMEKAVGRLLEGYDEEMTLEYRINISGNRKRWILVKGKGTFSPSGKCVRIAGSLSDISPQKEAEEKLIRAAMYDALTDLPNRTYLLERLTLVTKKKKRYPDKHFALMFLDYDGFKKVNDTYGHGVGDIILKMIAGRLKRCLRPEDLISRIGGDEFILLLEDCGERDDISRIAQRVLDASAREFDAEGDSVFLSVSIGIATDTIPCHSLDELIQFSDIAMFQAKNKGKGTYCFYEEQMHSRISNQWRIQNDLHKAVKNGELYLVYQPLIALDDYHVEGAEVLMRWKHPDRGHISPVDFIPTAEESRFITQLTDWLLEEVINLESVNIRDGSGCPIRLSINLSSRDFLTKPSILKKIQNALPHGSSLLTCLDAEVTETTLIENFEMANYQLSQMRAMGMKIKLDDFGTGYSSLSYLHNFPLDELKIDRSFICSIPENSTKVNIVRHIINLAHDLNLRVVAEGIETREQHLFLREAGCDMGQGYLYSPPLKRENFLNFIRETDTKNLIELHSEL